MTPIKKSRRRAGIVVAILLGTIILVFGFFISRYGRKPTIESFQTLTLTLPNKSTPGSEGLRYRLAENASVTKVVEEWYLDTSLGFPDFVSFARPLFPQLSTDRLKVLFDSNSTIISVRDDNSSPFRQFSRARTKADQQLLQLLTAAAKKQESTTESTALENLSQRANEDADGK